MRLDRGLVGLIVSLACVRASSAGAQQAPPLPIRPSVPTAWVHIDGDSRARLEAISEQTGGWAAVCVAPCDAPVPLGPEYRVAGPGIRASSTFGLDAASGQRLALHVSTASKAAYAGGIALAAVGTAALLVGTLVLVFAPGGQQVDAEAAAGGATAGAGLAAAIGGLVLVFSNKSSRATQVLAGLAPTAPRLAIAASLPSTSRTEVSTERAGGPRATTYSVFSASF